MQVLQRLFKLVQEKQCLTKIKLVRDNSSIGNKKEITYRAEERKKKKAHKRSWKRERIRLDCKDFNKQLAALIRRELKKEDAIRGHNKSAFVDQPTSSSPETTHNVGNKVLPVSDNSTASSTRGRKRIANKDNSTKPKPMSKMEELLRWSAGAKSQTGIKASHFRDRGSVKGLPSGETQFISESPKISFGLIPESCSSIGLDLRPKKENWITTDDEFIVLEFVVLEL